MTRKKNLLIESQHDACFLHALARSIALEPIYSFIWSAIRSPCVCGFFSTLFIHLQAYWRLELKLKFIYLLAFVNAIFVHIANESERAL